MESIQPYAESQPVLLTSSADDAGFEIKGAILNGSNTLWLAKGSVLDVFSASGRQNLSTCVFQCPRGQDFHVMDVAEVPQESAVLVALGTEAGSGAIALFDYEASKIVTGWSLAHRVTKLSLISAPLCNSQYPPQGLQHLLRGHHYIVAVGTEEGHVMLLAFNQRQRNAEGSHTLNLQTVRYLSIDEVYAGQAKQRFDSALVIPLNDAMYQSGRFKFETSSSSREVNSFPPEEVKVTALRYITDSRTLCVGYNFLGAFQLYALESLDLEFAHFAGVAAAKTLESVTDFTFLEPEDDPKNFCYVVVVAEKDEGETCIACFYSLNYASRRSLTDGNSVYEGLQSITPRLELNLKNVIDYFVDRPVRLVSLQSLPSYSSKPLDESSRLYLGNGLCCFSLEEESNCHLIIFDLNQWYLAQMPSHWTPGSGSSYLGLFSIPKVSKDGGILGTWIKPDSVTPYRQTGLVSQAEQFFQPTSLNFQLVLLATQQVSTTSFRGFQSSLLCNLADQGLQALLHPHNLYTRAVKYGLIATEGLNLAPTLNQMKETILSLALENGCAAFLTSCVTSEGANLKLVEQWAWKQVDRLRLEREEIFKVLFGQPDFHTEKQVCTQLDRVAKQLGILHSLYDAVDNVVRNLNIGVNEQLLDKKRIVYLLQLHLQVIIWFRHGGLLPEADPNNLEPEEVALCFPRLELENFYQQRRRDVSKISVSVSPRDVLLIDNLVPQEVQEAWTLERDEEIPYPPASFYGLLSAYLRPEVDDVTKHRLVQYVFLDLAWLYNKNKELENVLQHLVTFPSTYCLSPSLIKVTQAFWHLDHKNFDDALTVLMDPLVDIGDISKEQLRCVLRAFLYQDRAKYALRYITVRQLPSPDLEDVRLRLTILLANNLISEALKFVRGSTNETSRQELMQHFLNGCRELKKIHILVDLPLTNVEEEDLARFCSRSTEVELQEALLMFYLQRSRYSKAIALNEKINKSWPPKEPTLREKWERRNQLMQAFVSVLPPVMSKLTSLPEIRSVSLGTKTKYPQPLSTSVRPSSARTQYSASAFFRLAIDKTRSTWDEEMSKQTVAHTPFRQRKRKLETENEAPVTDTAEKIPFLTDVLEPRKTEEKKQAVFLTPKPSRETDQDNNTSKRRRLSPSTPGRNGSILNPEIASFLAVTPYARRNLSVAATPVTSRPPSILKSNRKNAESYLAERGQTPVHPSDSVDASKLIRFQLPFVTSPAQQSDMSVEAEEFLSFEEERDTSSSKGSVEQEELASTVCLPDVFSDTEVAAETSAEQDEVNVITTPAKEFTQTELSVLATVSTLPTTDATTYEQPTCEDAVASLAEIQSGGTIVKQVQAALDTQSLTRASPDSEDAGDFVAEMLSFTEEDDAGVTTAAVAHEGQPAVTDTEPVLEETTVAKLAEIPEGTAPSVVMEAAEPLSPVFENLLPLVDESGQPLESVMEGKEKASTVEEDIIKDALSSVGIITAAEDEDRLSYAAEEEGRNSEADQEEAEAYSSVSESSDIVCLDVSSSNTRDDDNVQESDYMSEEEDQEEDHDEEEVQTANVEHRYDEDLTEEEDFPTVEDSSDELKEEAEEELEEEEPEEVGDTKRAANAAKGYHFTRKFMEFSDSSSSSASEENEPCTSREVTETKTVRVTKTVSDDASTHTETREEKYVRSQRFQLQLTDSEGSEDEQRDDAEREERDGDVPAEAEGLEQSVQSSSDSAAEVADSSHDAVEEPTASSAAEEVNEIPDAVTEEEREETSQHPEVTAETQAELFENLSDRLIPETVAETVQELAEEEESPSHQHDVKEGAEDAEITEESFKETVPGSSELEGHKELEATEEVSGSSELEEHKELEAMEEEVQEEVVEEEEERNVSEEGKPESVKSDEEPDESSISARSLADDKDISEVDEGLKEHLLQVTLPELPCGPLVTSNVNNLSVILEEPENVDLSNFMEDDERENENVSEKSLHESARVEEAALLGSSQLQLSSSEIEGESSNGGDKDNSSDDSAKFKSPEEENASKLNAPEETPGVASEAPLEEARENEEVQPRIRRSSKSRRFRVPLPFRPDPGLWSSEMFRREGSVDSVSSEPATVETAEAKPKRTRRHSVAESPATEVEMSRPLTRRRASSLRSVDAEGPSSETPVSPQRSRRRSKQESVPSEAAVDDKPVEPDEEGSESEDVLTKPIERRQTRGRRRRIRLPFTNYSTTSNPDSQEDRGSPSSVTSEPAESSYSTRTRRTRRHTVGEEPLAPTEAAKSSRRTSAEPAAKGQRDGGSLVIPSPLRRSARLAESKTASRETSPESVASSTSTSRSRRSAMNPRRVGRRPTLQPLFEALVSDDESETETTKSSSKKQTVAPESSEDERNEAEITDSEKSTASGRGKGRPRKVSTSQASQQKEGLKTPKREASADATTSSGYNLRTPASKRKSEAGTAESLSTKKSRTDDSSDSKKRKSMRTRSSGARRTMRID